MSKPTAGIFGLTGCAGDQLVILNCEDRLLDLVGLVDIRDFLTASSLNDTGCELDVAFVEGAVLTRRDEEALGRIRARARTLVALGTCAVWGGVAAMDGAGGRTALLDEIYGPLGAAYDSTPPRALRELVQVDLNLAGCPIEKEQFLHAVASFLNGDAPLFPQHAVCAECRMKENTCLLETKAFCCGPLTLAGCNARCPSQRVPCIGCRGPADDINVPAAMAMFLERGTPLEDVDRRLRTFAPAGGRP